MALETGKWDMTTSSDNYGEFLKAVGVGAIQRNLAEKTVPVEELTLMDGTYELATITAVKKSKVAFTLGVETDMEKLDGRRVKVTFPQDGPKLIQVVKLGGDHSTITREYSPTGTYSFNGVTATRVFKRV